MWPFCPVDVSSYPPIPVTSAAGCWICGSVCFLDHWLVEVDRIGWGFCTKKSLRWFHCLDLFNGGDFLNWLVG